MSAPGRWGREPPTAVLGAALMALFVLVAAFGPALAPRSPVQPDLDHALEPPGEVFLLGTDENGVDLLSMVMAGARLALFVASTTTGISLVVGALVGAWAGTVGGLVDQLVMRVVDVLLSFPGIVLNLAVIALVARPELHHLVAALCLTGWVGYARVARGLALALREREFVLAARLAGAGAPYLVWRHVLPNVAPALIVQATFGFGSVVLAEASLSFLGLGPPVPYSWGALLAQGTTYLWRSSHLAAVPGVALALVILGSNLLGDALAERWDPRRRLNLVNAETAARTLRRS